MNFTNYYVSQQKSEYIIIGFVRLCYCKNVLFCVIVNEMQCFLKTSLVLSRKSIHKPYFDASSIVHHLASHCLTSCNLVCLSSLFWQLKCLCFDYIENPAWRMQR